MRFCTALLCLLVVANPPSSLAAVQADEVLPHQDAEARATELGELVRCPACSFQSINDSEAPTAQAMRRLVRDRVKEGQSDQEILDFLKSRYGGAVVMAPQADGPGAFLRWLPWGMVILALVGASVVMIVRRRYAPRDRVHQGPC